jgi:hypothetical protein
MGWLLRKYKRLIWRFMSAGMWGVAVLCLICSGYSYWYHHRPQPEPVQHQVLFQGVTYIREVYTKPRPNVVHIVIIDLDAPGIRLMVTPPDPKGGRPLQAKTTSQFVKEFGVQVAINGGFFYPFYAKGPLWFYPHVNDPVDVYGTAMFQGEAYSPEEGGYSTFYVSHNGEVSIGDPVGEPYYALSGFSIFLKVGKPEEDFTGKYYETHPSPRTAIALDKTGRTCILAIVDGRQPSYSEGMSLPELAEILIWHGGYTALNLDGGGSVTLVMEGTDGEPVVLNSPIHGRVPPGRERPVANHLGIFASQIEL